jgi:hypothetical protein
MHDPGLLVLYEPRPSARRALAAAAATGAPLTVIAIAPRDARPARCTFHTADLDLAIRDAAERELAQARAALGEHAAAASFVVLRTRADDDVGAWAAERGFATALVGARRALLGRRPRDPRLRSLRRAGIDVRIVT